MKQSRIKAQALALVLIVVVVAVLVAFSITSRVVQDIRQQGEERASTRAETISESAVENVTLQIQSGQLNPANSPSNVETFAISSQSPAGQSLTTLNLCSPESPNVETQCDSNSVVQLGYYKMIIQFKLFDNENLEVFMNKPVGSPIPSPFPAPVTAGNSEIIIHLKTNDSFFEQNLTFDSKLVVKGFVRSSTDLKVVGECLINLNAPSDNIYRPCLPNSMSVAKMDSCPNVTVKTNLADTTTPGKDALLGDICFKVKTVGSGISTYRLKTILRPKVATVPAYIDVSVTSNTTTKELQEFQMAMITAGVYSGTAASDQQVFQQTTRLVLLNKSVPEVADYVLYNGSTNSIVKAQ